jgi:hypothetical protein
MIGAAEPWRRAIVASLCRPLAPVGAAVGVVPGVAGAMQ